MVGYNINRITIFETIKFLLKFDHHLFNRKYSNDQVSTDHTKNMRGNIDDKKILNIDGDGVNNSRLEFCTNQSNETNGSDEDPILFIGENTSVRILGNLMLNERTAVITCK